MSKTISTRLGQILLEKGLVTAEQLDVAVKEQQRRRQFSDPFDENLGVNSSLGEILIELGFIDRLQLRRGLNWQLMVRKMAIVMSFCAPLMTVSYGAAAGNLKPSFTAYASSSSKAPKITPSFTRTSSSASSAPSFSNPGNVAKTSVSSSSKASVEVSSIGKSSVASTKENGLDLLAPQMPETITVVAASGDYVQLAWVYATDNIAVTRYKIYRDQVQIDTLDGDETGYLDFNIAAGRTYLYGISAGDAVGNWSPIKSVLVKTAVAPVDQSSQASSVKSSTPNVSSSSKSASSTPTASSAASSVASSVPSSVASSKSSATSSKSSVASSITSSITSSIASSSSSKVSSSSSSKASSVASSSSAGSADNSAVKTFEVAGPVSFSWTAPNLRENGSYMDITEVGGYELRYRKDVEDTFTYVTINDAWKNYHNFTWLEGTYVFQIAAYDKNGLYSNFIDIAPH